MQKVSISEFLDWMAPHAGSNKGSEQWGYVMGATGEIGTSSNMENLLRINYGSKWRSYFNSKWVGRRIFDCNGLAEGFYKEKTGTSINTRARYNYSGWCSRKGTMGSMPQLPGIALFNGSSTGTISHVGFLWKKYGFGSRDWYVIEARGYAYGVVVTKLQDRTWKWWGMMDKYFSYDAEGDAVPEPAPVDDTPLLRNGMMNNSYVKKAQERLLKWGYSLGTEGADGDFGHNTLVAVLDFQADHDLEADGIIGDDTWLKLLATPPEKQEVPPDEKPHDARPMLRKGMMDNADVKTAQLRLLAWGYNLGKYGADGDFGSNTVEAVMEFQLSKDLEADGIIGPSTWAMLLKTPDIDPEKGQAAFDRLLKYKTPIMKGDDVEALQTILNKKGYSCGKVDGEFGKNTREGVLEFQEANDLEQDGIVGPETVAELGGVWAG